MQTTEFNSLDATFFNIERRPDTWSIHLEIQVTGRIVRERLELALLKAIRQHPLAHARMRYHDGVESRYYWEFPEHIDHLPLTVWHAQTQQDLVDIRRRLATIQVPIHLSPAFLVYLVHYPEGDYLLFNVPHILADGLGTFRLIRSVVNFYSEQADIVPPIDPLSVRHLLKLAGAKTMAQRLERTKLLLEHLGNSRQPPVRIASEGVHVHHADDIAGYGVQILALTPEQTKQFMARRRKPATVNDMLLAAMSLAIKQWNVQHGQEVGRIAIMMPVNLRPEAWWHEVIGNFSSYVSVSVTPEQQTQLESLSLAICQQTTSFKEAGAAGTLIDLLAIPKFLPAYLKARLKELFPIFGKVLMETTWVSNLGRLSDDFTMGEAGRIKSVYFSPPAPMPCSISVGIVCFGERLLFAFRYRQSQFSQQAIEQFADLFKQQLLS
ncbi:condensation domain-containing protein [Agitococcus lubricus]|uniref:NRPS condensation-like uncharacterized protein n=1 Tax=Agitococcus lubricus TaxID=1077255 RepID=A0A2T5IZM0_9GAMM|nr:condensation domain-containing protein [Agitococcus lubricus]PTQ89391.1 NRPS condensation-like uncharacterized protein [Agitococcus lubricus]